VEKRTFDSITDLANKLTTTGYFIDPVMTQVVFLAAKLKKPLLLEGPAGSGKYCILPSYGGGDGCPRHCE
jgi:MoxR-like ATPase